MSVLSVTDLTLAHKRVFLRADLNVPLEKKTICNDYRLKQIRPTIDYILKQNAKIILATHIGRPNAHERTHYFDPERSTELLLSWFKKQGYSIALERDLYDARERSTSTMPHILLLENLRFFNGETEHNIPFAELLASLADSYVNDAFGLIHRTDTSVNLLPQQFPPHHRAIGLLIQKELDALTQLKQHAQPPYLMVIGGKKVAEKLTTITQMCLLPPEQRPQTILVGGAAGHCLLQTQGIPIGTQSHDITLGKAVLEETQQAGISLILPQDHLIKKDDQTYTISDNNAVNQYPEACDIGPQTIARFQDEIARAHTIFTSGTMGIFENPASAQGTEEILKAIALNKGYTVAGGGDTVAAIQQFGLERDFEFLSTGGSAALTFIGSREPYHELPALNALRYKNC